MTTVLWLIVAGNVLGVLINRSARQRFTSAAIVALALTLLLDAPVAVQSLAVAALLSTYAFRLYLAALNRWDP